MFDPKDFPFDATKMAEFFNSGDFTKGLPDAFSGNAKELIAGQKKNMEALVEANKAAAESYQTLFGNQIELFQKTMAETKSRMENTAADTSGEAEKAAFEQALRQMSDMATAAQKANTEAMEIVGKRAKTALKEMQDLAGKASKT